MLSPIDALDYESRSIAFSLNGCVWSLRHHKAALTANCVLASAGFSALYVVWQQIFLHMLHGSDCLCAWRHFVSNNIFDKIACAVRICFRKILKQHLTNSNQRWYRLGAERVIHASIFCLLLAGVAALCFWATSNYVSFQDNLSLFIATVSLSWGILLLVLYLVFSKMDWKWWI